MPPVRRDVVRPAEHVEVRAGEEELCRTRAAARRVRYRHAHPPIALAVDERAVRAPDRLLPASRRGAPVLVRRIRSRYEDDVLAGLLAPGGVRDPVAPLTDLKTPRVRLGQPEPRRSLTGGERRDAWRDEQRIA